MDTDFQKANELNSLEIAASLLTTDIPIVAPGDRVCDVWARLRGTRYTSVGDIAVCQDSKLVGLVRVEDLVSADDDLRIDKIMDRSPPKVAPGVDQEQVAWQAVKHGESSLAVVAEDGTFSGLIPPVRLLRVLLEEHDEDMARLGGYLHSTQAARRAGLESVGRRFIHRMPWLLLGLGGAIIASLLVGLFEKKLQSNLLLAFFIPGIVYLADAVGTQTETVVIRSLSVGVSIRAILGREILTGILVGAVIAIVFLPIALVIWHDVDVVVAVSISLFAACSTANTVAIALPYLITRLGMDPAFGSGPLATVIQDLLSIAIYLGVVSLIIS